jgi:hypothetical protein
MGIINQLLASKNLNETEGYSLVIEVMNIHSN